MVEFTRRAFAVGVLTVGLSPLAVRADEGEEAEVEFDGKAGKNPTGGAGGFKATGIVRLPKGCKVEQVVIRWQSKLAADKSIYVTATAAVDMTKTPATWVAEGKDLEAGEYWVDVRLDFRTPDGEMMAADSPDKRRVLVKKAAK